MPDLHFSGSGATDQDRTAFRRGLDVFLAGVAVIVPLVVTVYILWIALVFIGNAISPVVELLEWAGFVGVLSRIGLIVLLIEWGLYNTVIGLLTELVAVITLVGLILFVGFLARHRYGGRLIDVFDHLIASIPGIGTIYTGFREVGDLVTGGELERFEGVKLVQLMSTDTYLLGFETNRSPRVVKDATGHKEMLTIFLPFAPNPVTGGFLAYIPEDRVIDVDMTVEEGVRSIITSGIAGSADGDRPRGVLPGTVPGEATGPISDRLGEPVGPGGLQRE